MGGFPSIQTDEKGGKRRVSRWHACANGISCEFGSGRFVIIRLCISVLWLCLIFIYHYHHHCVYLRALERGYDRTVSCMTTYGQEEDGQEDRRTGENVNSRLDISHTPLSLTIHSVNA